MPKQASSAPSSASNGLPRASRYQKFVIERWNRADIKNAPYNPRTIDTYARKKLEENLKKVGLVEALVINRVTKHLVSGHQRLACLDALEGRDDYCLDVAVVELSEVQEREQNIFLNNPGAQGTWNIDLLATVLSGDGLTIAHTGFDNLDVEVLFDNTAYQSMFSHAQAPALVKEAVAAVTALVAPAAHEAEPAAPAPEPQVPDDSEKRAAELAAMKQRRAEFKAKYNAELDTEFYLVVVCGDRQEASLLLKALGRPTDDRYVDGRMLAYKLGIDIRKRDGA